MSIYECLPALSHRMPTTENTQVIVFHAHRVLAITKLQCWKNQRKVLRPVINSSLKIPLNTILVMSINC